MRYARFAALAVSLSSMAALVPSCTDSGPAGVYAYIEWRLRCDMGDGTEDRCSGYPDRLVDGFDGEAGVRVSCSVIETDASRTLTFSVRANEFAMGVQGASFPRGASTPEPAGCIVNATDDNVQYSGACGGNPPSATTPCQVTGVSFGRDDERRALISGQVYCVGMSPTAAPNIDRELTGPGSGPAARMTPLRFNIYDCPGYQPD